MPETIVTAGDPRHRKIHAAIVLLLRALTFDGIPPSQVYDETRQTDAELDMELPCIVVSIEGEVPRVNGSVRTTQRRGMDYPVRVYVRDRDAELPADETKYLAWRQTIENAFDQRPRDAATGYILPDVAEVYDTEITPKPVLGEKGQQYRDVVSGFLVVAKCFVARG